MTKYVLLSAGVTLVVVLGLMIDAQSRPETESSKPADVTGKIYAPGRIEGATPEVELRMQQAGRCAELLVREGQLVDVGQVLLQLDDALHVQHVHLAAANVTESEASLERLRNGARPEERQVAAAMLRAKQAELERAQLNWERTEPLHRQSVISGQEADDQRTLVRSLEAEVKAARARAEQLEAPARQDEVQMAMARIAAAKARLELAQVELDRTKLRAPTAGRILKLNVEPGELTGPESSEPPVVLADTSRYRVRAFVEEFDAPRVQVGMKATVTTDGLPGRTVRGRVVQLSPTMGQKALWTDRPSERFDTKTREVWIELDEAESFVVGLRVDVLIDALSKPRPGRRPSPPR